MPDSPAPRRLQNTLESLLSIYPAARHDAPADRPEIARFFAQIAQALEAGPAPGPGHRVAWDAGDAAFAAVPAVTWRDPAEDTPGRPGLEGALLFAGDGARLYLALRLDLAAARRQFGPADGLTAVRSRAEAMRQRYPEVADAGFVVAPPGDLGEDAEAREAARAQIVFYRAYPRGRVPEDKALFDDIAALMAVYRDYLSSKPDLTAGGERGWLVVSDPARFDLAGATRQRDRLHLPVPEGVRPVEGDRAFLWSRDPGAGLVAVGRVAGDPEVTAAPESQRAFEPAGGAEATRRVPVAIERVLPERLRPDAIRGHSRLRGLPVLAGADAPWQPLDDDAARSLATLANRTAALPFEAALAQPALVERITERGFHFEPWQVAAFAAALRTKPFVILAGVSGTGKSQLPALVAEATGARCDLVAVRPDWTDSADVLGYVDLRDRFRPGRVLEAVKRAHDDPRRYHLLIIDEMNLARVEHYFAEVLSHIEDRHPAPGGGYRSSPLLGRSLEGADAEWGRLGLPPNLGIVGTVNMDESAHGFSRKVLDRAFTLEFSDFDLAQWEPAARALPPAARWPVRAWHPRGRRMADLRRLTPDETARMKAAVAVLEEANEHLRAAQLQVGYRTRDEVALFLLHAAELAGQFRDRAGDPVDPLDLALKMKLLPRIQGGSHPVRVALRGLLAFADGGDGEGPDDDGAGSLSRWEAAGRPAALPGARFPRTAARLALMWDRLLNEGFTSFWL